MWPGSEGTHESSEKHLVHRFVFWALLSTILWAWIFTLLTDTVPEKKVTLYVQTEDCRSVELTLKLEEEKPEGIKMVKVHPFSYAAFGNRELLEADVSTPEGKMLAADRIPNRCPGFAAAATEILEELLED